MWVRNMCRLLVLEPPTTAKISLTLHRCVNHAWWPPTPKMRTVFCPSARERLTDAVLSKHGLCLAAGHGTHVAGLVGANGTVVGMAPDVTLGASSRRSTPHRNPAFC